MPQQQERVAPLQRQLVSLLIASFAYSSLFIAPLLYWRDVTFGSDNTATIILTFLVPVVFFGLHYSQRFLSSYTRAIIFSVVLFLIGIIGALAKGFLGTAFFFMLLGILSLTMILPFRQLLGSTLLILFLFLVPAAVHMFGLVSIEVDINLLMRSPLHWISYLSVPMYVALLFVFSFSKYNSAFSDVVEELEREKNKVTYLAEHDQLTNLPNMRVMQHRGSQVITSAKRRGIKVALLFIDLDGFKSVNDTFGHDAGDFILHEVAQILTSSIREEDVAARIGGDEFVVLLNGVTHHRDVASIAQTLIDKISTPFFYDNQTLNIGASIGIALFPDHGDELSQLRAQADNAMYEVKRSGKNNYVFAQTTNQPKREIHK